MVIQVGSWVKREKTLLALKKLANVIQCLAPMHSLDNLTNGDLLLAKPEKKLKFSIVYGPRIFITMFT
jgi:hypothetical protein